MRNRIISLIISVLLLFTLVACTEPVINKYESLDSYEQTIINASNEINDSTAIITVEDESTGRFVSFGSAVVFDSKKELRTNLYYAITTANIASRANDIRIFKNPGAVSSKVENYTYNEELMFGIITFKSVLIYEPVKISKDNKAFNVVNGQTIVTSGTAYDLSNVDSFKSGYVTNDNYIYNDKENYFFTHSAANNYGELGSGVFNLNGELVGLNIDKIHELDLIYQDDNKYAMLGHNISISTNEMVSVINQLNLDDLNNSSFDVSLSTNTKESNEYSSTELEKAIKKVYDDNNEKVVKINSNNIYYSGLLISKTSNSYTVLTTNIYSDNALIIINGNTYESTSIIKHDDFISTINFTSNENLSVYSSKAINENIGIEILKGQFLVGIGSIYNASNNSLSVGNLSKEDFNDSKNVMHDLNLNYGQDGSPIFNLNGELVGVSTGKQNSILISGGNIVGEGLGYLYNINNFVDSTTSTDTLSYTSKVPYEKKILETLRNVYASTVTIRTNTGLGSGVIVNKEKQKDGTYLYYVLTNHHVIEGSREITIHFNQGGGYVAAKDFQTVKNHDMGIVRFVSSDDYNVAESDFNSKSTSEEPVKGQLFISIGTPVLEERKGYITLGHLSLENRPYKYDSTTVAVQDLNLLHDGAINPGNSGGPVFDLNGRLVAINAAKIRPYTTPDGEVSAERVGYSLSANVLAKRFSSFKDDKYIRIIKEAKLGVEIKTIQNFVSFNPNYRHYFLDEETGFVVSGLDYTKDAATKFEIDDVIYKIEGNRINTFDDIKNVIQGGTFGSSYTFEVLRVENNNIVVKTITVKLS